MSEAGQHRANWWQRLNADTKVLIVCMAIIVGLTVASSVYNTSQNSATRAENTRSAIEQRQCLSDQIKALTTALTARAELSQDLTDATTRVINSFAKAAANRDPNASEAEQERAARPIIRALENYTTVQERVKEARRQNPLPEYPTGKCVVTRNNPTGPNQPGNQKEPEEKDEGKKSSNPTDGNTSSNASADPGDSDGNVRRGGSGGSGGNGSGGGSGGGDKPNPPPNSPPPPDDDPPLVDIDIGIDIPNVLKANVDTEGKPPVEVDLLPKDD